MSKLIDKILSESEFNFLKESKNIGSLYHFTSLNNINRLLETGIIRSHAIAVNKQGKTIWAVSTTRDRNFDKTYNREESGIITPEVRITLNGNKISEHYKIKPFNFFKSGARQLETESEEVIITNIKGLKLIPFIIKIDVVKKIISDFDIGKIYRLRQITNKLGINFTKTEGI